MNLSAAWESFSFVGFGQAHAVTIVQTLALLYIVGLACFFIERIRPAEPGARFFKKDFLTEVAFPLFNLFVTTPFFALLAFLVTTYILEPWAPYHVLDVPLRDQPLALQVLVLLLLGDAAVYIEHRISHGPLWRFHAIHHVTPEVNWLTHARLHPINALTIAFVGLATHFVFGIDGRALVIATALAQAIAVWEHLNLDFAWPWPFCYLFVSPRFHRWHHATELEAMNKNFALVFPFYDRILGTYYCPDRLPRGYGIPMADPSEAPLPPTFTGQLLYPFRRPGPEGRTVAAP